ncbi:hypothetical protein [Actinomadura sp. 6N118]|uniref:hypothetical protein n=1 Tax=Actinomadura sp. 6N118 TaxID=3375151 RepID=UPI00379BF13B
MPVRLRLPVFVFAVCQFVLLLWWAAYYPGAMSYDSISYVWHVTADHWMANHSVPYDGLVWLSLQLTGDVALLTFLQTVFWAATLAYTADVLHELGVRARWAALAAVVSVALPALGQFPSFLWKDVPFTISALFLFAVTGRLVARRRAGEKASWKLIGLLALGLTGLVLFRNNGFLTVVIATPILVVALSGIRWKVAATCVGVVGISVALTAGLYPALDIEGPQPSLTYATAYADVAVAYYERPEDFTKGDMALMRQVAPLSHWATAGSSCYNADWLTNRPGFSKTKADPLSDQLLALWKTTIRRSPDLVAGARFCRGSVAWAIWPGPKSLDGRTAIAGGTVTPDRFTWSLPGGRMADSRYLPVLKTRPLVGPVRAGAEFGRRLSRAPQFEWLLWRGAFWSYVGYAAIGLFAWRRRVPGAWALVAMIAGVQLAVLAANPAQLFRYVAAPMLVGLMAAPLLTVALGRARRTEAPSPAAEVPGPAAAVSGPAAEAPGPVEEVQETRNEDGQEGPGSRLPERSHR